MNVNDIEQLLMSKFSHMKVPLFLENKRCPSRDVTPRFTLWLQDTEFTAMLEEADVDAWSGGGKSVENHPCKMPLGFNMF